MIDLRLSIRQTFGQIGIQTNEGSVSMESTRGEMQIQQPPAKVEMQSPAAVLTIDSSAAWDALGVGPNLATMSRIYSQSSSIALQAIAKIVADGNRMAQITNPNNAFAELAADVFERESPIQIAGEPGYNNVKVQIEAQKPTIDIQAQKPVIQYTPGNVNIQYTPGNVDIYMRQQNSIKISVSRYDIFQ
ncbi:DUF6470 family protein [Paenibacillus chartarius]|uniref:DUF6470 family protein n=1 Tax=Paenibacillus chartarius TaxID=747481 RepID=A0ABV6DJY6_9BACL